MFFDKLKFKNINLFLEFVDVNFEITRIKKANSFSIQTIKFPQINRIDIC